MRTAQANTLVLVDPYHGRGPREGMAPELLQLLRDFPSATVVAAMEPRPGRLGDVLLLGEKGLAGLIDLSSENTKEAVQQKLQDARGRPLRTLLQRSVVVFLSGRGRAILDAAVDVATAGKGVRDLASALELSKPTLLRWCADSGLPTPRRLLIWLRALSAAELLDDTGRSVLHVAWACGYSSDRALRRALQATVRIGPSELRRDGAFKVVAREFTEVLATPQPQNGRNPVEVPSAQQLPGLPLDPVA